MNKTDKKIDILRWLDKLVRLYQYDKNAYQTAIKSAIIFGAIAGSYFTIVISLFIYVLLK